MGDRFERAVAAIDAANAEDPTTLEVGGTTRPKELVHGELMANWVRRLDPDASEAQLLAARAAHVRRWTLPRSAYPQGRAGYLRWRTEQKRRQAAAVAEILEGCGYDEATVEQVRALVAKERLGRDAAAQVHEDALCLVFLQTELAPTARRLGDDKAVAVLAKTARKMSPRAQTVARRLDLAPEARALLERALSG